MTALLIGVAIGLFAAVIVAGYRHGRRLYTTALLEHDDGPPPWVNNGNDFFQEFVEAVHFAQWEQDLEEQP
jgi:hypothetical protein